MIQKILYPDLDEWLVSIFKIDMFFRNGINEKWLIDDSPVCFVCIHMQLENKLKFCVQKVENIVNDHL